MYNAYKYVMRDHERIWWEAAGFRGWERERQIVYRFCYLVSWSYWNFWCVPPINVEHGVEPCKILVFILYSVGILLFAWMMFLKIYDMIHPFGAQQTGIIIWRSNVCACKIRFDQKGSWSFFIWSLVLRFWLVELGMNVVLRYGVVTFSWGSLCLQ